RVSKKRIRNRTAAKAARPAAMLPARTWPRMPLPSGVGSLELAGAQEAAHDADPVGAEEPEERERGGDVQRDHEREIERLALRLRPDDLVPAEPRGDQHRKCPRLEIGKSSVTPWTSPITMAWSPQR